MEPSDKTTDATIKAAKILIVDDEFYTRKVIRTLLMAVGFTDIHDTEDGPTGLEAICRLKPDIVILDWEMPRMDGPEFVQKVRAPAQFPYPSVPIIMLTGHAERSRVQEAVRLGVNEYLIKPVSSAALFARIAAALQPRPMVERDGYYGPEPRKHATYKPPIDSYTKRTG